MKPERDYQQFLPLPSDETIRIAWPTPNQFLFDVPEKYFAHTRVNHNYGKPGFTRDCGKRFHRGCDIAPVNISATGKTTRVMFTDCATGRDFESDEPTFVPHDDVFCVFDGAVVEIVNDSNASDFGKHIVVEHAWPCSDEKFYTLYAHLSEVIANHRSPVTNHQVLGRMGQTSRSADARNWMAVAPHLHFEVRDARDESYDPLEFLQRFLTPG